MTSIPNQSLLTRQQVRQVDRIAIERYGIPGIVLMENAARAVAKQALRMLPSQGSVLMIAGGGNNGGDGFAAARHLHNAGCRVHIVLLRSPSDFAGDAAINLRICQAMNLRIADGSVDAVAVLEAHPRADLIIDAIFGTGLSQPVREDARKVIEWINAQSSPILAVDVPSGLDCDTGRPLGAAVRATHTVTFVARKVGMNHPESMQFTGQVTVAEIGCPKEIVDQLLAGG